MELALINDQIVPLLEARISAHDRSIYFGDGIYEVVRSYHGRLFAMDRHMERLARSLRELNMLERVDLAQVEARVNRALAESKIPDAVIYFQISRGESLRVHDYPDDWQPSFLLTLRHKPPRMQEMVTCITQPDLRWKRCDIKSLNLLANVMAKHAASQKGCYEAILIDESGLVTEGTACSVLIVKNGTLQVPPLTANILPGITRALMLEWAPKMGIPIREESFTPAQLLAADEVLITGTGTEVMGVSQIDQTPINNRQLGPITQKYQKILTDITLSL